MNSSGNGGGRRPTVSDAEALDFHARGRPGKLEITPTKPMATQRDLSLAYSPGVAVPVKAIAENPETAFERAMPYLEQLELLLVMSVRPGFGGQSFMPDVMAKVREAWRLKEENGYRYEIEVDGGINRHTAKICVEAGASVLVAGNALFGLADMGAEMSIWKGYEKVGSGGGL